MRSSGPSTIKPKDIMGTGTVRNSRLRCTGGTRDGLRGPVSIALIDDDWDALSRLREIIEQDSDLAVVVACRCAAGAMLAVERYRPAVLILDVRLPDRDGIELIRDITTISDVKVIVFTAALYREEIVRTLRSGAAGSRKIRRTSSAAVELAGSSNCHPPDIGAAIPPRPRCC